MIKFSCRRCKATIKAPETMVAKNVRCPTCGLKNVVPRAQPRKPVPKVVWVAGALILFAGMVWAVWPGGEGSDEEEVDPEVERRKELEQRNEERWEADRPIHEKERADRIDFAKDAHEKHKRDIEKEDRERLDAIRRDREAYEAKQKMKDRMKEQGDPDKNRYE